MQQAVTAKTPVHLWIVGIVSLLWNAFGCYQYLMVNLKNPAFMAQVPADQVSYMDSLPAWLTAFWAIGVWGGIAGSLLLLIRNRYSVWAFALSAIGAVVGLGYQLFATERPASMTEGAMGVISWAIILFAVFLAWYSWNANKKGVLR